MSAEDRVIYDWDLSPEERAKNDPEIMGKHRLPSGFMNERVNLSDWEGSECVGGVFNGSCWSETSNLFVLAEVIPAFRQEGILN